MHETTGAVPAAPTGVVRSDATGAVPAERSAPTGILLGAGSDPVTLAMAAFAILAVTAGMVFVQQFSPAAVAVVVPVAIGTTLAFFISAIWAAFLGESVVAALAGVVTGFSLGLAVLLLGLFNGWFPIPNPAVAADIKEVYFIAFAIFWATLALPFLRLPVIYEALVVLVTAATALLAAGSHAPGSDLNLAAGCCLLAFATGLFYIWANQALQAVGLKGLPMGRPLVP
jgi:hypothetical protein